MIVRVETIGWAVVPLYVRPVRADRWADAGDPTARRQMPAPQTPASGGGQIRVTAVGERAPTGRAPTARDGRTISLGQPIDDPQQRNPTARPGTARPGTAL